MKNIIKIIIFIVITLNIAGKLYSQDEFEMKDGDVTYTMKKYYMCLLKTGPNRTQDSVTAAEIQKGHMENISRLSKEGKLMIAGPFGGKGELRGIFILSVKSKEEAEMLCAEDPAVKSGRLTVEVLEWWSAKGSTLK